MSEALDKPLASAMGMKSLLVSTPVGVANGVAEQGEALLRAPSLLNGGLEAVSPLFWAAVLAFSAGTELYATKIQKRAGFRATLAALGAEDVTGIDIDGDGQVCLRARVCTCVYEDQLPVSHICIHVRAHMKVCVCLCTHVSGRCADDAQGRQVPARRPRL